MVCLSYLAIFFFHISKFEVWGYKSQQKSLRRLLKSVRWAASQLNRQEKPWQTCMHIWYTCHCDNTKVQGTCTKCQITARTFILHVFDSLALSCTSWKTKVTFGMYMYITNTKEHVRKHNICTCTLILHVVLVQSEKLPYIRMYRIHVQVNVRVTS